MRVLLVLLLAGFGTFIGYGVVQQRQLEAERAVRMEFVRDSIRKAEVEAILAEQRAQAVRDSVARARAVIEARTMTRSARQVHSTATGLERRRLEKPATRVYVRDAAPTNRP